MVTQWFRTWLKGFISCPARRRAPWRRQALPLLLEQLEDRLTPSALTVANLSDSGVAGDGSLRGEIVAAQSGDTIQFAAGLSGTITLTGGELLLSNNLTIQGPGAASLTISGNNTSRVFDISSGATVTIAGLTIANGKFLGSDQNTSAVTGFGGGGVLNQAGCTLTLDQDTLSGNTAAAASNTVDVFGGGLLNEGQATINSCTFSGNQATGGGGGSFFGGSVGGAIDNFGGAVLSVTGSTFTGNQALGASFGGGGMGGAIENNAGLDKAHPSTATINNCQFTGNVAGQSYTGDISAIGNGGAIDNEGTGATLTILDSTLSSNMSNGYEAGLGGGVMNYAGSICSVLGCSLLDNLAINQVTHITGNNGRGSGGGIENDSATLNLSNSTLEGNEASGSLSYLVGNIFTIQNGGYGGGIDNYGGATLTVTGSTFNHNGFGEEGAVGFNTIVYDTGYGGGIANEAGGFVKLTDTIVAASTGSGKDLYQVGSGSTFSGGYDLIGDGSYLSSFSNSLKGDPLLAPLGDYGGLTQTMPLITGSPASGAGAALDDLTTDQSGAPRGNPPNIGASELVLPLPYITSITPPSSPTDGGTTVTITGVNLGSIGNVTVDFGSIDASSIASDDGATIVAVAPSGKAGVSVDVTVTTANGTSAATTWTDQFSYYVPASLSQSTVSADPDTIVADDDGFDSARVVLIARDANGNQETSGGLKVTFAIGSGNGKSTFSAVTDNGDGTYVTDFTSTIAGSYTITASINGQAITSPLPTITVIPDELSLSQSTVTVSPSRIPLGGTATVTLSTLRDAYGNQEPSDYQPTFYLNGGGGTFSALRDNGDGTYSFTFTGTTAGSDTILIDDQTITPTVTVVGPASLSQSTLAVQTGGSIQAGGSTQVTLIARDANGNQELSGGLKVTFAIGSGSGKGTFSAVRDNGDGTYTVTFTGTTAGSNTITASINTHTITSTSPIDIIPASPSLTTTPGGTVVLGSGGKLTASATLVGGFKPSGTMTFTLYGPNNSKLDSKTVTVSGNGTYKTPIGYSPSAPGTYQWVVTYSGDKNNNSVVTLLGSLPETVSPASPSLSNTPGGTVVLGTGGKLTDSVKLTGGFTPTGTITFRLYAAADTTFANPLVNESVGVRGNGVYSTPTGSLPVAAGTYEWLADYSGDGNNTGVASISGFGSELVNRASPSLTVTQGGTVVLGSGTPLTASAKLAGGFNPGGTVTLTLYGPGNTTVDIEHATISGNGVYKTPTGFLPTGPGVYQWTATYGGDGNNKPVSTSKGAAAERVNPASPTLSLSAGPTVVLGTGVPLTASVVLAAGFNPTGAITFTLLGPNNSKVETETTPVSGNGSYSTSTGFLPVTAGTYRWVVGYSGDNNNKGGIVSKIVPETVVGPGATVVGSTLYLVGGNTNDQVQILAAGSNPTGSTGIKVSATLNGHSITTTYSPGFSSIVIVGFGGNDTIQEAGTLTLDTLLSEGDGNDTIQLGNGNDTVTLGNGNNVVATGNGTDSIQTGDGNNLIVAGLGQHTVQAGNDSNILIDGTVQLTQAGDSLSQVLNDWMLSGNTPATQASIRSRLAVTDNSNHANTLQAGSGLDWFWATFAKDNLNRKLTDLLN